MTALTIEALGLSQEELAERIVERAAETLLNSVTFDDEGREYPKESDFQRQMKKRIQERINQSIDEIAAEYLISRAETYLTEQVNYEGKSKSENGSYSSWSGAQTRLTHLVHKHLNYNVESAMKEAIKNANAVIVGGIEHTVRIKLQEVANALKVEVKTK